MRLVRDATASGQVIAFVVSAGILTTTVGAILYVSQQTGRDDGDVEEATLGVDAHGIAETLVGSPGSGWLSGPDSLTRLGLREAGGSGLDPDHLEDLRGAGLASATNGLLDYEEARTGLGLSGDIGTQFHVSIHPVALEGNFELLLGNLKTAYLGDWSSLPDIIIGFDTDDAMKAAAQAAFNTTMDPDTANERTILTSLGLGFTDTIYIADEPQVDVDLFPLPDDELLDVLGVSELAGGVFPDHKQYLDAVLPDALATGGFDQLVVGSTVDHSSLTSAATKDAIRDFVMAGGSLFVLGSESQNFQWLQPLFSVGTDTVNGGAFAPDLGHPLLWTPNELAWQSYDNYGLAWDIKSQGANAHYDDFEHVIQEDGEDVLAVSADGAFGDGRIFLTTFRPQDIFNSNTLQAEAFVENMVLYADRGHLHLEYGPAVPSGLPVAAAVRYSTIDDPDLGPVAVAVQVRAWHGAATQGT